MTRGRTTTAKPRKLTAAMESFATSVASGMSQTLAYRTVFAKAKKWKDSTVWTEASRLAAMPAVRSRIDALKRQAARSSVFTLADHLRNLETISQRALDSDDFNAAARAEEARGKAAGFYVQKTELTGKDGGPIETKQTRDLTDEELNAELLRHGLEPRIPRTAH